MKILHWYRHIFAPRIVNSLFDASIAFNDYNSVVLGRQQFVANVNTYNIATASATSLTGNISRFTNRLKYIALSHTQQLTGNGLSGNVSISDIKTNPNMESLNLSEFNIPGKAFMVTAGLDYACIRSHNKNLYLGTDFNFTDSSTTLNGMTLFKDNIRTIDAFASYRFLIGARTQNRISVTITQGLKILDASDNPPSRIGEKLDFTKFVIDAAQAYTFRYAKLSSYLALYGQYAFNSVPSVETISYGGILFGSGYDPSTISGDRGILGRAELQHIGFSWSKIKLNSQVFIFGDFGYVWDINNAYNPDHQHGSSAGAGFRATACQHILFDFMLAQPLNPAIANNGNGYLRILFNIKLYA